MIKLCRNLLCSAVVGASLVGSIDAAAETVQVKKDCSLGPANCTITASPNQNTAGFFNTTNTTITWSATYANPAGGNFNVSQVGPGDFGSSVAKSTTQFDGGSFTLPTTGKWWISWKYMQDGTYSVSGPMVFGDTHITTTNGIHFDFQGAGEFVLAKHGSNGFEVQARMMPLATVSPLPAEPHTGLSSCVSLNTAAAIRAGRQRITYQPNLFGHLDPSGMQLRVDGNLVRPASVAMTLNDGTKILRQAPGGELVVEFPDQSSVRITPHWWKEHGVWYLDFDLTPPDGSMGIVGAIHDDWLPALADGSSMGPRPTALPDRYKALYVKFADSWRVSDATTLFDYAPGTSTKTYTLKAWPPEDGKCELLFSAPLQGVSKEIAERACTSVFIPHLKRSCVQDVMVTGNTDFGKNYVLSGGVPKKINLQNDKPKKERERHAAMR